MASRHTGTRLCSPCRMPQPAPRTLVVRRHQLTAMGIRDATCLDGVSITMLHRIRAHPGLAEPKLEHLRTGNAKTGCATSQAGVARPSCCDACPGVDPWWPGCTSPNCRNRGISKAKWQLLRSAGAPEPGQLSATRASPCLGRPCRRTHNPLHGHRVRHCQGLTHNSAACYSVFHANTTTEYSQSQVMRAECVVAHRPATTFRLAR